MCLILGLVISIMTPAVLPAPYQTPGHDPVQGHQGQDTKIERAVCQYMVDTAGAEHMTRCVRSNMSPSCQTLPLVSPSLGAVLLETWRVVVRSKYRQGKVISQEVEKVSLCSRLRYSGQRKRQPKIIDQTQKTHNLKLRENTRDFLLPLSDGSAVCSQVDLSGEDFLVSDPEDCTKFFSCTRTANGAYGVPGGAGRWMWLAYHMDCPDGTTFDGRRCVAGAVCGQGRSISSLVDDIVHNSEAKSNEDFDNVEGTEYVADKISSEETREFVGNDKSLTMSHLPDKSEHLINEEHNVQSELETHSLGQQEQEHNQIAATEKGMNSPISELITMSTEHFITEDFEVQSTTQENFLETETQEYIMEKQATTKEIQNIFTTVEPVTTSPEHQDYETDTSFIHLDMVADQETPSTTQENMSMFYSTTLDQVMFLTEKQEYTTSSFVEHSHSSGMESHSTTLEPFTSIKNLQLSNDIISTEDNSITGTHDIVSPEELENSFTEKNIEAEMKTKLITKESVTFSPEDKQVFNEILSAYQTDIPELAEVEVNSVTKEAPTVFYEDQDNLAEKTFEDNAEGFETPSTTKVSPSVLFGEDEYTNDISSTKQTETQQIHFQRTTKEMVTLAPEESEYLTVNSTEEDNTVTEFEPHFTTQGPLIISTKEQEYITENILKDNTASKEIRTASTTHNAVSLSHGENEFINEISSTEEHVTQQTDYFSTTEEMVTLALAEPEYTNDQPSHEKATTAELEPHTTKHEPFTISSETQKYYITDNLIEASAIKTPSYEQFDLHNISLAETSPTNEIELLTTTHEIVTFSPDEEQEHFIVTEHVTFTTEESNMAEKELIDTTHIPTESQTVTSKKVLNSVAASLKDHVIDTAPEKQAITIPSLTPATEPASSSSQHREYLTDLNEETNVVVPRPEKYNEALEYASLSGKLEDEDELLSDNDGSGEFKLDIDKLSNLIKNVHGRNFLKSVEDLFEEKSDIDRVNDDDSSEENISNENVTSDSDSFDDYVAFVAKEASNSVERFNTEHKIYLEDNIFSNHII